MCFACAFGVSSAKGTLLGINGVCGRINQIVEGFVDKPYAIREESKPTTDRQRQRIEVKPRQQAPRLLLIPSLTVAAAASSCSAWLFMVRVLQRLQLLLLLLRMLCRSTLPAHAAPAPLLGHFVTAAAVQGICITRPCGFSEPATSSCSMCHRLQLCWL